MRIFQATFNNFSALMLVYQPETCGDTSPKKTDKNMDIDMVADIFSSVHSTTARNLEMAFE